jgi:hypothetical protein
VIVTTAADLTAAVVAPSERTTSVITSAWAAVRRSRWKAVELVVVVWCICGLLTAGRLRSAVVIRLYTHGLDAAGINSSEGNPPVDL